MPTHNLSKNLSFLRNERGIKQHEIQAQLGFVKNTWSNWENDKSEPSIDNLLIISQFFEVSLTDLLEIDLTKGKGNPKNGIPNNHEKGKVIGKPIGKVNALNEPAFEYNKGVSKSLLPLVVTVDSGGRDNIVHVPIKARAGYLIGYGDPSYIEGLYSYNLPGMRSGTYRSFEVEGLSMKGTLNPHDWVVGQWVESLEQIRENRVHIIVTRNDGILIKRVLNRIEKRGKLYLKSDTVSNRSDYPIIEMDPADIAEIWYANIKFSSDFSEPSEIFTRVNDLELDVMELKKMNKLK